MRAKPTGFMDAARVMLRSAKAGRQSWRQKAMGLYRSPFKGVYAQDASIQDDSIHQTARNYTRMEQHMLKFYSGWKNHISELIIE